ncbi:MAG: peptide chain release factor N(5)-glutamine methyltransferase [Francisellaceae bacterium]
MDIKTILTEFPSQLINVSDTAKLDVILLLEYVSGLDRSHFYAWPDHRLTEDQHRHFLDLLNRRLKGEPVAYLIGRQDFWSLSFKVNHHTLIPRADTETLVEYLLNTFDDHPKTVLDLGTGSGAIAISLAHERKNWRLCAVDISREALTIACQNAKLHRCFNVEFVESSWFEKLADRRFDIIVSNPPYIDRDDVDLCRYVAQYEPVSALIAADDGYADIADIINNSRQHLSDNGCLVIEHGYKQGPIVKELFQQVGFKNINSHLDISGHWRATSGVF